VACGWNFERGAIKGLSVWRRSGVLGMRENCESCGDLGLRGFVGVVGFRVPGVLAGVLEGVYLQASFGRISTRTWGILAICSLFYPWPSPRLGVDNISSFAQPSSSFQGRIEA
jgi:hypothetical protein